MTRVLHKCSLLSARRSERKVLFKREEEKMNFKKLKKIVIGTMACACLMTTTVPVYAQTVNFNITVGKTSSPDPLSKRASKKDGEQKFYVTATAFDDIGSIRCTSKRIGGGVKSATITVKSSQINKKRSGVYSARNAKAGEKYYMDTTWNSGPSKLNVKGRYTP